MFCQLSIFLPIKNIADLIVELGKRTVEAKELFQGSGHKSRSLDSFFADGRKECLLSMEDHDYMSNYLPSSTMHMKGKLVQVVNPDMLT